MKKILLLLLLSPALYAQGPITVLFGSGVPGGGVASVPGTHYVDNSVSPAVTYICSSVSVAAGPNPPAGTQTCNWTQVSGGVSIVASNPATCVPGQQFFNTVSQQSLLCTSTNTLVTTSGSFSTVFDATLYGVVADGLLVTDASWTNGANPAVVTITGTDPPFTSYYTGKTCAGPFGAASIAVGTFTFTDATHGTCTGAASGTASANGNFVVGTDNGTNFLAAWNALKANPKCGVLLLPQGLALDSKVLTGTPTTCYGGAGFEVGAASVRGMAQQNSVIGILPNIDLNNCVNPNGGCFFSPASGSQGLGTRLTDFSISGMGITRLSGVACGSGTNVGVVLNAQAVVSGFALTYGLNSCSNTFIGIQILGQGAQGNNFSYVDSFGTGLLTQVNGPNVDLDDWYSGSSQGSSAKALDVATSGILTSHNMGLGPAGGAVSLVTCTGNWNSTNDYSQPVGAGAQSISLDMGSGCNIAMNGGKFVSTTGTYGVYMRTGSGVFSEVNTTISSAGTAALSGDASAGKVIDIANNTWTGSVNPFTGSYLRGSQVFAASKLAQVAAVTDTTMVTVGAFTSNYRFSGNVDCTGTSAAATATLNLKWTDTSNTAQTSSVTATCTALGSSSNGTLVQMIRAKNATTITYGVTIANTPTYDVSVGLEPQGQTQ